jgi:hypothetical protein
MRLPGSLGAAALLALAAAAPAPVRAEDPPPAPAKTLQQVLAGKVVSFKGRRAEVSYDFQDPGQAKDWAHTHPFLRPPTSGGWRVDGKALRGDGNCGWKHRAIFDGEVRLKATVSSEDAKNFGVVVLDEDHSQFDLFAIADTYFSLLDRKPPLQHMVTTFLPAGTGPGDTTEWRYVKVQPEPRVGSEPFEITVRKKGAMNEFRIGPSARLAGADKECTVGPRLVPAFYTLGARVVVTRVALSGVLDAKWLREQGVAFEGDTPPDPEPLAEDGAEAKPPGEGKAPAPGEAPPIDWQGALRKLTDAAASAADRAKAADDLAASKEKRALRGLIDLLYREDDAVGREHAARAFKAISGKETGYRHDGSKEQRRAAMPRVWEVWYGYQELIEREDRKPKEKP